MNQDSFEVTFLGTGTSQGIPVITCDCQVCTSDDIKDSRLRCSVLMSINNKNILIDAGPDFRQQMLTHNVKHLDAILLTHEHNDHTAGLDDIRPFNFRQQYDMPVFGLERVLKDLKRRFKYIFDGSPYPGVPKIVCHTIYSDNVFSVFDGIVVQTISVYHGKLPILGFRIGDFVYITDASQIDAHQSKYLQNIKVLVLNALQIKPHYSHFTLKQAIELIDLLKPEKTYLTHISHNLGKHKDLSTSLPPDIMLAYDGLKIKIF